METLIVTGGIATGKSSFCQAWLDLEPATVLHDADAAVHALYGDPAVRLELAALFGSAVLLDHGGIDRALVRSEIFQSPAKRRAMEGIFHPRVRLHCQNLFRRAEASGSPWFLADIPLYFEAGCWKPTPAARVIVVACSRSTQLARLLQRNPFDKPQALRIIDAQSDLSSKMVAADHVVWNEGQPSCLPRQTRMLRACLQTAC